MRRAGGNTRVAGLLVLLTLSLGAAGQEMEPFGSVRPHEVGGPTLLSVALSHRLVSSHTSPVAVDKTPTGSSPEACKPVLVPLEVPHGMDESFAASLPGTATPSQWLFVIGLLLVGLAATLEVAFAEVARYRSASSRSPRSEGWR